MTDHLFSIVIPTYNRADFIMKTIDSILAQTHTNFEVIVIDDGSSDNTDALVTAITDTRVKYVKKVNGERGAARNAGARLAKGAFVNFVDSDDVLYNNHLSVANKFINEDPDIDVFHLGYDVKDPAGKLQRDSSDVDDINKQILSGNILSCNGVFIRTSAALENPFSENRTLSAIEDWELWIRLAAKYRFAHVPTITSTVVNHDERSVMSVNTEKIKAKTALFIDLITGNKELVTLYGSKINKAIASALTYTALHLAIAGSSRSEVISYTYRGVMTNPGEIFRKRFLVILKLLVLR
jgi:glycosyltransferase involved in cell wall biosynthesis